VSPVKYELGFHIPEDDILHSHCRDYLKPVNLCFYTAITKFFIKSAGVMDVIETLIVR
jgi:hypothetical protein